jgi:hypothetical protein
MRPATDAASVPRATSQAIVSKILYQRQNYHFAPARSRTA